MIDSLYNEVTSYDRFIDYQIQIIDKDGNDHFAKDLVSFDKWINVWQSYPNIKVEGLDDRNYHTQLEFDRRINSNHMFVNNIGRFSFKKHKDDTNVYLHVVKGKKFVHMNDEIITVSEGQGIHIPKGFYHKVDSEKDTWALSIGYYE